MSRKNKADYEALGRMLAEIYESGYIDKGRTYKMSFLKGVAGGFGGVIGATIVVAMLAWVLSLFHDIPFVNDITNNIQHTLQNQHKTTK